MGHTVYLSCLTRGEGGSLAFHKNNPDSGVPSSDSSLARVRQQELQCSAKALGVHAVSFMDYRDRPPTPGGLRPPEHDSTTLKLDIRTVIDRYNPTAILTHGSNGDYGHPAHTLLHHVTRAAVHAMPDPSPAFYSFNAFHPTLHFQSILNPDDWATFILDISPYKDAKRESLACHKSQWPVFVDPQSSLHAYHDALSEYVDRLLLESYCWHAPPTDAFDTNRQEDPLTNWLKVKRRDSFGERLWRFSYSALRTLKNLVRPYLSVS
jgi:LmbE family N-acetylglucosaminyl deacetylase